MKTVVPLHTHCAQTLGPLRHQARYPLSNLTWIQIYAMVSEEVSGIREPSNITIQTREEVLGLQKETKFATTYSSISRVNRLNEPSNPHSEYRAWVCFSVELATAQKCC